MRKPWVHLDANETERDLFSDLPATLQRAGCLACEPNRLREVHRIQVGGGTWFLKIFLRTQLKNQIRSLLVPPRCRLDGAREASMALALIARGIPTARPVAFGRCGAESYYLCREMAGTPMRECIVRGRCERKVLHRIARFVGAILAGGVVLPDLSTHHVYLREDDTFAVLDLHNGSLRAPRLRDLVRILKHFRRSLRGLEVQRHTALAFAARLCKAAGFRHATHQILARVPPLETHGRYDFPGRAQRYRHRDPERTRSELARLRRAWPGRPGELVLDSPCGNGRLLPTLTALQTRCIGLDRSRRMLEAGARACPLLQADGKRLPLADHSVDGVVVFRFLHHLEATAARELLAEACRVARRFVVVSFFHPLSWHALSRRLRRLTSRRAPTRHSVSPARLGRWFAEFGFAPHSHARELPFLHEFRVASFVREDRSSAD